MSDEKGVLPVLTFDDELAGMFKGESQEVSTEEATPTISSKETEARAEGWMDKDAWVASGKDPDEHVSPHEFLRAGSMINRIRSQGGQIEGFRNELAERDKRLGSMETALKQLVEHNQKITASQMKQARTELFDARAQATVEGDTARMAQIDEALADLSEVGTTTPVIEDVKPAAEQDPVLVQSPEQAAFVEWTNRPENKWFQEDPIRRGAFIALGDEAVDHLPPGTSVLEILDEAKKQLVKAMPAAFAAPKPPAPSGETVTEVNSGDGDTGKHVPIAKLSPEQLQVAKSWSANGIMSVQEYADQLALTGEIQ